MFFVDNDSHFQTEPVFVQRVIVFIDAGVPFLDGLEVIAVIGRFLDFPALVFQIGQMLAGKMQPVGWRVHFQRSRNRMQWGCPVLDDVKAIRQKSLGQGTLGMGVTDDAFDGIAVDRTDNRQIGTEQGDLSIVIEFQLCIIQPDRCFGILI